MSPLKAILEGLFLPILKDSKTSNPIEACATQGDYLAEVKGQRPIPGPAEETSEKQWVQGGERRKRNNLLFWSIVLLFGTN